MMYVSPRERMLRLLSGKVRQTCGGTHVFQEIYRNAFLFPTYDQRDPLQGARLHRKETVLKCRINHGGRRRNSGLCLVCAFWLAKRDPSLKSRRQVNAQPLPLFALAVPHGSTTVLTGLLPTLAGCQFHWVHYPV